MSARVKKSQGLLSCARTREAEAAREYLMHSRHLRPRIEQLQKARQQVATWPDAGTGNRAAPVAAFLDAIDTELLRLEGIQTDTARAIGSVADPVLACLLTAYYVRDKTWEQVAEEIHYSCRYTMRVLHPRALARIGGVLSDEMSKRLDI